MISSIIKWIINNPKTTSNIISFGQFIHEELKDMSENTKKPKSEKSTRSSSIKGRKRR